MNEAAPVAAPQITAGLIRYTHLIYGLHALAVLLGFGSVSWVPVRFVFSLPSIVAVILNYARRHEARGTWLESHFHWQIRTFWFALLWILVTALVSVPLMIILIGVYVAYLGMVTRFSVRLDDGDTMTVARQNSSTGAQKNELTPESRVMLSWDLNDAFPLTSHSVAETQLGAQAKGAI